MRTIMNLIRLETTLKSEWSDLENTTRTKLNNSKFHPHFTFESLNWYRRINTTYTEST